MLIEAVRNGFAVALAGFVVQVRVTHGLLAPQIIAADLSASLVSRGIAISFILLGLPIIARATMSAPDTVVVDGDSPRCWHG